MVPVKLLRRSQWITFISTHKGKIICFKFGGELPL